MPVVGKHLMDEDLCALLWQFHGLCEVVTRNGHTQAIRAFLTAHGAPADVPIRTVKKGQSKADYALAGLPESFCGETAQAVKEGGDGGGDGDGSLEEEEERAAVLMVDDSIAELVDERVAKDARVHRVLFVRALL